MDILCKVILEIGNNYITYLYFCEITRIILCGIMTIGVYYLFKLIK